MNAYVLYDVLKDIIETESGLDEAKSALVAQAVLQIPLVRFCEMAQEALVEAEHALTKLTQDSNDQGLPMLQTLSNVREAIAKSSGQE